MSRTLILADLYLPSNQIIVLLNKNKNYTINCSKLSTSGTACKNFLLTMAASDQNDNMTKLTHEKEEPDYQKLKLAQSPLIL